MEMVVGVGILCEVQTVKSNQENGRTSIGEEEEGANNVRGSLSQMEGAIGGMQEKTESAPTLIRDQLQHRSRFSRLTFFFQSA